jgi:hypothetical protein
MEQNTGQRIGDSINVRGILIRGMIECSLGRSKVYFRVMFMRCAKGDTPTRATLFKNSSDNKMLDQINSERYTVLQQKIFTITAANVAPVTLAPVTGIVTSGTTAGVGTKLIKMWIPGAKFGRGGHVGYENASTTQVKFYDYRIVVLAYDWYGTPQDGNNVGFINEIYTKLYFKDA